MFSFLFPQLPTPHSSIGLPDLPVPFSDFTDFEDSLPAYSLLIPGVLQMGLVVKLGGLLEFPGMLRP